MRMLTKLYHYFVPNDPLDYIIRQAVLALILGIASLLLSLWSLWYVLSMPLAAEARCTTDSECALLCTEHDKICDGGPES